MKFFSTILNRPFDTVEELTAAEAEHERKLAELKQKQDAEDARQKTLRETRTARKAAVDAAFDAAYELQAAYISDYNTYCFYKSNIFWPFVK